MAKPGPRANPCDATTRAARLASAKEFWRAAETIAAVHGDEGVDAYTAMCVIAGIAAADVICCTKLGVHAQGQDHNEAVALLAKADKEAARSLSVLLGLKSRSAYRAIRTSVADGKRAGRAAAALIDAAQVL